MHAEEVPGDLARFRWFERVLAGVCLLTPLVLLVAEGLPARDSISAYYNMAQNQWFYFLLTAAVLLFLVNAFVWEQHAYNAALAFGLALIVLFNHDEFNFIHWAGVVIFFLGNGVVIALFSRGPGWKMKVGILVVMVLSLVALLLPGWTLFWTEWLSMGAIATHFVLDSLPVGYDAMPPGTRPSLAA